MNIQELQKLVSNIETINSNVNVENRLFHALKNNQIDSKMIAFLESNESVVNSFIASCEQAIKKQNRVLMTFSSLDEMNAFIKAGNECGTSWFDGDVVHCYCYKFVSVKKTKKSVMQRAWVIAKEAAAKFGGSSKLYFAQSLKMAWSE